MPRLTSSIDKVENASSDVYAQERHMLSVSVKTMSLWRTHTWEDDVNDQITDLQVFAGQTLELHVRILDSS